jgi:hypothetical protein
MHYREIGLGSTFNIHRSCPHTGLCGYLPVPFIAGILLLRNCSHASLQRSRPFKQSPYARAATFVDTFRTTAMHSRSSGSSHVRLLILMPKYGQTIPTIGETSPCDRIQLVLFDI